MALKKRKSMAGSDQERIQRQRERTSRDANRIVSVSNKMAVDLQNAHGAEESVTIKNRFDTLMKTYGYHPAATDIDASLRAAIAATAILEVYLVRAEEAEVVELEAAAAPVMSLDWPPRGGTRDRHARQRQWEVSRRGSGTYSRDEMSEELYDGPSGLAADWQRPADYTRYADGDAAPRRAMPAGGGASGSPVDVGALAKGTKVRAVSYTHLTLPTKRIV